MRNKTGKSVLWSVSERFLTSGIQLVLNILIARILTPSDYGLIAMQGVFLLISQIFVDSGFSNTLIQKKDRNEVDFSTVFYFNIIMALAIYLLLFMISPIISSFYNETKLDIVLRLSSIVLILSSLSMIHRVKLVLEGKFKLLAFISFVSVLCSGSISLWMAYDNWGVYALVSQSLLNATLNTILLLLFVKWKPGFLFSVKSFRILFPFGFKLLIANLLSSVYTNLYTLVIGKKFTSTDLGYYNRAFSLGSYFSLNITDTVMRVVYPIQCGMQDDDVQLRMNFLSSLRMLCYVVFPFMIGLVSLGEPFVSVLLSEKWIPSVILLQLLCVAYMWYPMIQMNMNLINVKGRSDYTLKAEFIKKIFAIVVLVLTLPFGVYLMCLGLILVSFFDLVIITYFLNKILSISFYAQFKTIFPILLLSVTMGVMIYFLINYIPQNIFKLFFGIIAGFMYYLILSYLFSFKELKVIYRFLIK